MKEGKMRHLALYRKYRPRLFSEVIGQKYVINALKNQIMSGRIGHALLFTGTRGTGKTTCAKIYAKAVNCLNPRNGEPCLECEVCRGIENESVYDVVEMDAASNNGVDDIRDILSEVNYLPVMARYKVYIIDEVHMLSQGAFNALLKTLEEPPGHVIFILATTEIHKVPATILSRCQRYDFTKLETADIAESLLNIADSEGIDLTPGAARMIATLADGAMRDANSILETCASLDRTVDEDTVASIAGVARDEDLFGFARALIERDTPGALLKLSEMNRKSIDYRRLNESFIDHFSDLLMAGVADSSARIVGVSDERFEALRRQAVSADPSFLIAAIDAFSKAAESISRGNNPKVAVEIAIYSLTAAKVTVNTTESRQISARRPEKRPSGTDRDVYDAAMDKKEQTRTDAGAAVEVKRTDEKEKTDDMPEEFTRWPRVIEILSEGEVPLYSVIKNTTAYLYQNVVYIKGNDSFNNYIRNTREVNSIIKDAIRKASGTYYNIGGFRNIAGMFETRMKRTSDDELKDLMDKGVQVNIIE